MAVALNDADCRIKQCLGSPQNLDRLFEIDNSLLVFRKIIASPSHQGDCTLSYVPIRISRR
jgi:hypothetical protein